MKSKKIFITAFHSFITKNILNTDAFLTIKGDESLTIFLMVPKIKEDFFRSLYEGTRVKVIGIDTAKMNEYRSVKVFSKLSKLLGDSHYLDYKKREALDAKKRATSFIKFYGEKIFTNLFAGIEALHPIFRNLFRNSVSIPEIVELIEEYNPTALFTTDVFDESDILFANEFKKRGLKVMGMVRSWDNCYSKGLLRVLPDEMIVNNHTLLEEVISLHGMPIDKITVLGSPQHDSFINEERSPREEFCLKLGLDPKRPYIVFAPAGSILSDTDHELLAIMIEAREMGEIPNEVQFLVRNHPNHPADLSRFEGSPGVVIDNPGKVFNRKNPKDTELTLDDNKHLADTLYHSAMVIWIATTLGLDTVIFDKPQITIDFDGSAIKPYNQSVRKYHDEDHMKKMLDLGGVSIAHDKKELISFIHLYLKDPFLNQEGRSDIIRQQFYKLDGKAGKRIGEHVLSFLE